ncbi:unnamed protein product [Rhizopus microsporus]
MKNLIPEYNISSCEVKRARKLDYLTGNGQKKWEPKDKLVLNGVDITSALVKFRNSSIKAAEDINGLNPLRVLSLSHVDQTFMARLITYSINVFMDPIVAIQYFFGSQRRNIMALDLYDDVTIIELYTIAKNETEKHAGASESQLNALATICSASEDQFKKIKNILKDELSANSKAFKYVNQGIDYHSKLKRKYEEIIFEDKDETTTPMEEPAEIRVIESVVQNSLTDEEITFIENFISKKKRQNVLEDLLGDW